MEIAVSSSPASGLGMALVISSAMPLLLVDAHSVIRAASSSFCSAFDENPAAIVGTAITSLGSGEWDLPQLRSLLKATVAGNAAIREYEMDLVRSGRPTRKLIVNAHKLDYLEGNEVRLAIAVLDVTATRLAERTREEAVREKHVLLQELQHRVANSLQIIASVLMQSARKVQSDEARSHLHNAHHRVMSIATLQRQLSATKEGEVRLGPYLTDLCESIGASMIHDQALISIKAIVDKSVTTSGTSVSLGLIVTELVINALKHAFPNPDQHGLITVEYWSRPTGWRLTVEDDGVGFSADQADHKPGLGTGIIEALSGQLNATVTATDLDPGTRVAIVHSNRSARK